MAGFYECHGTRNDYRIDEYGSIGIDAGVGQDIPAE